MHWKSVKKSIAAVCAQLVPSYGTIGLGSGTTSYAFIEALGERYTQESLNIRCIASSKESEQLARTCGLPLIKEHEWDGQVQIIFDGADAVDAKGSAIKGAGGALLREKIIAKASKRLVLMVDERKWRKPWAECLLPVEVVPFGVEATLLEISKLGYTGTIRRKRSKPFVSSDGHWIVDITLTKPVRSLTNIDTILKNIPGVIETGVFFQLASEIVIGYGDGQVVRKTKLT